MLSIQPGNSASTSLMVTADMCHGMHEAWGLLPRSSIQEHLLRSAKNRQENSTRVYGSKGWTMEPPLRCAANVQPLGALNNPKLPAAVLQMRHWPTVP